jgi:hypothetical protein
MLPLSIYQVSIELNCTFSLLPNSIQSSSIVQALNTKVNLKMDLKYLHMPIKQKPIIVVCATNVVKNYSLTASQNSYTQEMVEKWNIFSENDWTVYISQVHLSHLLIVNKVILF